MNAVNKFLALATLLILTGCGSLMPKNVEFFQKKVAAVPVATAAQKETQKQAAALAAVKAEETYRAAIAEDTTTDVLAPAADSALLSRSVSTSLGPPIAPWEKTAAELSAKLDTAVAKLDKRFDKFADAQEKVAGKKIEGTGLFQVPYFVWLGGVALLVFLAFIALKVLSTVASISNPGVAVGTRVVSLGASRLARGFSQMVKAGVDYEEEIRAKFGPEADKIIEIFKKHHKINQDSDVKSAIKTLIS